VYTYRFAREVQLVKTPSMPYDESKKALSSLETGPSTNLLPVLEKYPDLSQGVENSFLFVITDGCPGLVPECKEQLESIDDPTACLQYEDGGRGFQENYDAFQIIEDADEIQKKSTSLLRRLVEQGGASL
jgi:hypothetical protein